MQPRALGKMAELGLVRRLRRAGWSVLRAPASGARSREPVPDVVAVKHGVILMFEVKYRARSRSIYMDAAKWDKLRRYAEQAGAELYLAVKLRGEDDYRVLGWDVAEHVRMDDKEYMAWYKEVIDRAGTLTDLLARIARMKGWV